MSPRAFLVGVTLLSASACGGSEGSPGGLCTNTCQFANDGECDDGGAGSLTSLCSLGTDCGDCGSRASTAPPDGQYTCEGTAQDPSSYGDSSSCTLGAGIWVNSSHDCESGYADDCDDVIVVPGDVAYARTSCIDRIGCAFVSEDGTRETHPLIGGECFGDTPPCSALEDEVTCGGQGFICDWEDPSQVNAGGCEDANGYIALYNVDSCAEVSAFAESGSAHWDTAYDACLDMYGCSWRHADGTVETSDKSDFVLPP